MTGFMLVYCSSCPVKDFANRGGCDLRIGQLPMTAESDYRPFGQHKNSDSLRPFAVEINGPFRRPFSSMPGHRREKNARAGSRQMGVRPLIRLPGNPDFALSRRASGF